MAACGSSMSSAVMREACIQRLDSVPRGLVRSSHVAGSSAFVRRSAGKERTGKTAFVAGGRCPAAVMNVQASEKQGIDADSAGNHGEVEKKMTYHFLVANADFMLDEEEHFQEVLRERLRFFKEHNRDQDFWLLYEPDFLNEFPDVCKRLKRPAVALVSTDSTWITFMKLRLDRVLRGSFEADTFAEASRSKPFDFSFKSPEEWKAPYPKYQEGWWTPFVPPTVAQN